MAKIIKSMILMLIMLFSAGFAFAAVDINFNLDQTVVTGKIYNADFSQTIEGANVEVTCAPGEVKTTTSRDDGSYNVVFSAGECTSDKVNVVAYTGDLYGSTTSVIYENVIGDLDLAVANVAVVPEFGLIVGLMTMLGALGLFFYVRK